MSRWSKNISAHLVLERLSQCRTIGDDGIEFISFDADNHWTEILETALTNDAVPSSVHAAAIKKAARRKQAPTPEEFRNLYDEECAKIRGTTSCYLVALQMCGKTDFLDAALPSLAKNVSLVSALSDSVFEKISAERARFAEERSGSFATIFSDYESYKTYVAKVYAHTPLDAFERVYDELSMLIGCIAFVDRSEAISLFGDDMHRPAIDLLIAPGSTVHNSDGTLAYEGFWYSEWMPNSARPRHASSLRVTAVMAEVRRIIDAVKYSPWRGKSEAALSLYYNAFSEHQASNSLLSGWRLLEVIAGGQDVRSDLLIKRASSFFGDRQVAEAVGYHLRDRRNGSAHGERLSKSPTSISVRQLRSIIHPLMGHFLANPFRFRCLEEFWSFCDAPRDGKGLESAERILHAARSRMERHHSD